MYLKEAFRYQNFLNNLMMNTMNNLRSDQYAVKTVQEHQRTKVYEGAEDEIIDLSLNRPMPYNANQFMKFLEHLLEEKEKLTVAISAAKRAHFIDIDAAVASNRFRQQIVSCLDYLCSKRPTERITKASSYKFNAEGNQVQYIYDVKETTVLDFDKEAARKLSKDISEQCDEISTLVDKAMVELEVNYTPLYSVTDNLEEAIATYFRNHPTETAEPEAE